MVNEIGSRGALVRCLMVGLALLGCARVGSAQGTWSIISLPQQPGDVRYPRALAVDGAGNRYVADSPREGSRIQQRDTRGHWSEIATEGTALGQVHYPVALAADTAGNLYVAQGDPYPNLFNYGYLELTKRDARGEWSVIASEGFLDGDTPARAVDSAGNLYVTFSDAVLKYTPGH